MKILTFLYRYRLIKLLKEKLRPIKHFVFGKTDFYRALHEITTARGNMSVKVVFDVGAAGGEMTRTVLREYPNATVFAFEPNPDQFQKFLEFTKSVKSRVCAHNFALGSQIGTATLRRYSYADASSILPISKITQNAGIEEVDLVEIIVRTLDEMIDELNISHIDFLKIDVEGFENEVLAGGGACLLITDNVYIEISPLRHKLNTTHHIECFSLMQKAGFSYIDCYGDYFFSKDPMVLKRYY